MPGLQDPHQDAMLQTEARFPNQAPPEPRGFRTKQAIVLLVVVGFFLAACVLVSVLR